MCAAVRGDRSQEIAFVDANCHFVAKNQARCEFEEFVEAIVGGGRITGLIGIDREFLLRRDKTEAAFLEHALVDHVVEIGVGQPLKPFLDPLQLHCGLLAALLLDRMPVLAPHFCLGFQKKFEIGCRLHGAEQRSKALVDALLPKRCGSARRRVTAVVDKPFLGLADQRVAATPTLDEPGKIELMLLRSTLHLAPEDITHAIEQGARDNGLVDAVEHLVAAPDMDLAVVEGVVEQGRDAGDRQRPATTIAQTLTGQFSPHGPQCVSTGRVLLECIADERCGRGVGQLRFGLAAVEVSERRTHGIEALLEAAVNTLLRFLTQIADVVGCNDGLDISR